MKSGFKMRSGNAPSFKMMGSSPAKVDLTKKTGLGPRVNKEDKKTKKSTVAVDGQIEDAQSDYERDLKIKNKKTLARINKEEEIGDRISEGTIESQDLRRKENERLKNKNAK